MLRLCIAAALGVLAASSGLYFAAGVDLAEQLAFLPGCGFRGLSGVPCPGCGMTRAMLLLSQLRLGDAISMHPASPLLLAVMAVALVAPRARLGRHREAVCVTALCAVLGLWAFRLSAA